MAILISSWLKLREAIKLAGFPIAPNGLPRSMTCLALAKRSVSLVKSLLRHQWHDAFRTWWKGRNRAERSYQLALVERAVGLRAVLHHRDVSLLPQ